MFQAHPNLKILLMDSPVQVRTRSTQPCAACRMLRRRCATDCILAPYFPIEESDNFARVHKVFGASNVIKMLQMVEESRREDAVKSMVYEAKARLRDPIYGSAGTVFYLQKHVKDLEMQLQSMAAQVLESQRQRDQLLKILMDVHSVNQSSPVDNAILDRFSFMLGDNSIWCDPNQISMDCFGTM
ncbi:LOB domain-containing protein 1-like [Magnolia sinica]|uniref:LOB domain-containing protein 1-like n=1 Tax=Magnolia sinica TaxID=86752 RepID=UPI00265B5152|nr:LOB domain-containing protein 1-like [Magnolia sinica]